MKRAWLCLFVVAGCVRTVQTGRDQLILIDEPTEIDLGTQACQEALSRVTLTDLPAESEPASRVGKRILAIANKMSYRWEFLTILDDESAKAWCLPGGKMAVSTGIFPAAQDEAGLAFLLSHVTAHILLRHSAERLSTHLTKDDLQSLAPPVLGTPDPTLRGRLLACLGAASDPTVPPYSKEHEAEADRLGLELMAKAGYNPRQALDLWKRVEGPQRPVEFLAIHANYPTRFKDMESRLASAQALFDQAIKAPVAKLPEAAGRKGRAGGTPPAGSGVIVANPGGTLRTSTRENRHALLFEFWLNRDVYVESVRISGPDGLTLPVAGGLGIPANAKKQAYLTRPDIGGADFPAGTYTFTFAGAASGRPFSASCAFEVR
jgi:hypothetical protein